jgi:hypothetical protein
MQFLLFVALTGIAFLFDEYFENHPGTLNELQTQNEASSGDHGTIYLFTQSNTLGAKTSAQKTSDRKLFDQLHNKFIQKCHQLRNQVLKTEPEVLKQPLFLSYHHLIFRHYYFTHPDDDPLIS